MFKFSDSPPPVVHLIEGNEKHSSHPKPKQQTRLLVPRQRPLGWVACAVFVSVSVPLVWLCYGQRSAWATINTPGDNYSYHTLLGYNCLRGQIPIMDENKSSILDIEFLCGVKASIPEWDCYVFRIYYPFFCSLLTPLFGITGSLVVVNWLAWALCAWTAWRLSKKLFADELAAALAVLFVLGGTGMIYHLHDYGAHMLSFAIYYQGVHLICTSGVLSRRAPFRTHLMLGAYLAVASLAYSGSVILIAVYLLGSLRHNAIWCQAAAILLAVSARPLWKAALPLLGAKIVDAESEILALVMQGWLDLFRQPWPAIAWDIVHWVSQLGLFESPAVILLGLWACFYLPRKPRTRWFGALVVGLPLLFSLVVTHPHVMSGYQYYGISIWIYCWLGCLLAKGLRGPRVRQVLAGVVLCLVFGSQVAFATAHLWGWLGPLKTYIAGWPCGRPHLAHWRAEVISLTGFEKTPALFGGPASLAEAGLRIGESERELEPGAVSFCAALTRRLLPCAYLALLGVIWARSWRRLLVTGVSLAAVVLSAGVTYATLHTVPTVYLDSVVLPVGGKLTYRVTLSASFLEKLATKAERGDVLAFFFQRADWDMSPFDASISAGSTSIPIEEWGIFYPGKELELRRSRDTRASIEALRHAGELTVELVNRAEEPMAFVGWQRRELRGRELVLDAPPDSPVDAALVFPAVEVRLMRGDGSLKLAGF